MPFKDHEIKYLNSADLGRLATVRTDGTPQASPVGFTYNAELGTIDIPGFNMSKSQKFRNIATNPHVAFVVDDIASRNPWRVRCLEIRGVAEPAQVPPRTSPNGGELDTVIIRIAPKRIISYGIDDLISDPHTLELRGRNVDAAATSTESSTESSPSMRDPL